MSLKDKVFTIASEIYGADGVSYTPAAERALARIEQMGFGSMPVCMAKTQYSLSDDQNKLGRPTGFTINVRDVYVSAGAGFVVVLTGAIMTMPGLPKKPAADGKMCIRDSLYTPQSSIPEIAFGTYLRLRFMMQLRKSSHLSN